MRLRASEMNSLVKRRFGKRAGQPFLSEFVGRPWEELVLSPIKAIELEAATLPDVISLAQGIPSFDTPEEIKRSVIEQIRAGSCARYTLSPGLPALRELLSEVLRREGMSYDADSEIIVTCGSIEAVSASLLALLEPGEEVLLPSPSYTSYLSAIKVARAVPQFISLDEDAGFDLDPERLAESISSRTRAVVIAQPNNPTGTIFSREAIEAMLALADKHDLLVLSDEVYREFVYTDRPVFSPASLPCYRGRVVRICSFSKAFAMTGWRVGFLHTDHALAARILRVHDALVTCAPVASQYGAVAALTHGEALIAPLREELRRRRQRLIEHLDLLPSIFDYQTPQASYFVFPRVKDTVPLARDSRALAHELLHRARVACVPGVAFGPTGEGHLRFCFARPIEDIDRAFERLQEFFSKFGQKSISALPLGSAMPTAPVVSRPSVRREAAARMLRGLARSSLAIHRPLVIGIAGGRGKTVAKRTLAELLATHFQVRSNPLSYNTEIGVSLSVLGVAVHGVSALRAIALCLLRAIHPLRCDVLILEYGVARPGDMDRLLRIVEPDIAIVTPTTDRPGEHAESLRILLGELEELGRRMARKAKPLFAFAADLGLRRLEGFTTAEWIGLDCFTRDGASMWLTAGNVAHRLQRDWAGTSELYAIAASVRVAERLGLPPEKLAAFLSPSWSGQ